METSDEMEDNKPDVTGDHPDVLGNGDPDAMGDAREVIEDSKPDAIGCDPDESDELDTRREGPGEADDKPDATGQDPEEVYENVEDTHEVGTNDTSERVAENIDWIRLNLIVAEMSEIEIQCSLYSYLSNAVHLS